MRVPGIVCALAFCFLLPMRLEAALAHVNPVAFDFGQVKVGDTVEVTVTIENVSSFTLTLSGGALNEPEFFALTNCGGGIPAAASCELFYRFIPTARGEFSGTSNFTLSGGGRSEPHAIPMQGTGTESLAEVYPVSIDFGSIAQNISVSVPITVFNSHSSALDTFAGGGVSPPFSVAQDCTVAPVLAPGNFCEHTYTFLPTSSGLHQDSTSIGYSSDGITEFVPITLTGTGKGPIFPTEIARVYPVAIGFGTRKRGLGTPVPMRIRNISPGTLQNFVFSGIGPPFSEFHICGGGVPVGGDCFVTYTFIPDQASEVSASTSFSFSSSAGGDRTVVINLSGTASGTLARVSPVTIDFGRVPIGDSHTQAVTIFNDGDSALTPLSGFIAGAPFPGSSSCFAGVSVGASCSLSYTFTPTTHGPASRSPSISFSNGSGLTESITIELFGFGDDTLFADGFESGL